VNQVTECLGAWRSRGGPSGCSVVRGEEEPSDEMLLAGFGAGDPRASRLFVLRFERGVLGIAVAIVRDRGLAEDVGQQAFERAWRHADSYDPCRGSVRAWINTIVRNLAVDAGRAHRPCPLQSTELEPLLTAMIRTPEGHALDCEASAVLRRALAALPPQQARAVVLAAVHGYSGSEIARLESVPVGTAKSRVRGGLIKLREAMAISGAGQG